MKKVTLWCLMFLVFFGISTGKLFAEEEQEIPITSVPEKIQEVIKRIFPKIKLIEAEIEKTKSGVVYELEGKVDDKIYEIVIKPDGTLIRIELEEEDEDDEDEDEEEGEDDDD